MNIIDHHKVWKARQSSRRNPQKGKPFDDLHIAAVFFDGKKDYTLVKEKVEDKWYSSKRRSLCCDW